MGRTSKKLHAKLSRDGLSDLPTGKVPRRPDMPDVEAWIKQGMDPVHAAYAFVQHITSFFAEGASQLPEMKKFARIVAKAEDDYLPSAPPMSPLTTSFFTTWAFYDLQFDDDTLATCLIESNDVVSMNPDQLDALKKMAASRMGIYQQVGMDGQHVRLRELVTNAEFVCHSTSGYRGKPGELWYVRLLPPLLPDLASYQIVFTTPYILMASMDDWLQFFGRAQPGSGKDATGLHQLFKHGPDVNYWNEFVFKAYHHHQSDAIFLAGIPDLKATLPHA
ncbi:hypothetical protein [Fimbriiglobus ruber]|uniref:Uncharacterized protein n=1 Tax=Fimbriiglobus ruber TaxID=1908690 RepID=A0A225E7L1_9BACT|nr:hypothetical protein [Fimbriiglobus ruber]OWK45499.1 hypothetical protein FRUB_01830 [Fimbriiglobus ruber]